MKKEKPWGYVGVYLLLMLAMGRISAWGDPYHPAPYRVVLEGLSVLVWLAGLWVCRNGRWDKDNREGWFGCLILTALPHIPLSIVSRGSWVCLGGSLLLGAGMWFKK